MNKFYMIVSNVESYRSTLTNITALLIVLCFLGCQSGNKNNEEVVSEAETNTDAQIEIEDSTEDSQMTEEDRKLDSLRLVLKEREDALRVEKEAKMKELIKQYSGKYRVAVAGVKGEDETYTLYDTGTAVWIYSGDDKIGKWILNDENTITIWFQGNSGKIEETYKKEGKGFINTLYKNRSLVKF